MPMPGPIDYGITGVILIVLYWVLYFGSKLLLSKKGVAGAHTCVDPITQQRVLEIHTYTEGVQQQIAHGDFKCVWEGRDEVRDFKEIMTRNAVATEALTTELKLTRNGKG